MKQPLHSTCVSSSRPAGFALDEGYAVAYTYDMFGRFHSVSSSASSASSAVNFTYSYLPNTDLISDGRWQYTWNGDPTSLKLRRTRNRLITAKELISPTNRQSYTVAYAYDHQSRRVAMHQPGIEP